MAGSRYQLDVEVIGAHGKIISAFFMLKTFWNLMSERKDYLNC